MKNMDWILIKICLLYVMFIIEFESDTVQAQFE